MMTDRKAASQAISSDPTRPNGGCSPCAEQKPKAAFRLGFFVRAVLIGTDLWAEGLGGIDSAAVALADEIHPNVFAELKRDLAGLSELDSTVFQSGKARHLLETCPEFTPWPEPNATKAQKDAVRRWQELSNRLEQKTSRSIGCVAGLRNWYECGQRLGQCMVSLAEGTSLAFSFEQLQQDIRGLPQQFLASHSWLVVLSEADTPKYRLRRDLSALNHYLIEQTSSTIPVDLDQSSWKKFLQSIFAEMCNAMPQVVEESGLVAPPNPPATGAVSGDGGQPVDASPGGEADSPKQDWQDGYIGLDYHDGKNAVRRQGKELDLSASPLNWGIIKAFVRQGENWLPRKALKNVWEIHGRARKPAPGTVNTAICDLNIKLQPLGIKLKYGHTANGWRLEAIDEEQPSKRKKCPAKRSKRKRR